MKDWYREYRTRLEEIFEQYAENSALNFLLADESRRSYTFSQVFERIHSWSASLSACGIMTGDRVAIIAPLAPNTIIAGLTLSYAHITAVLLDISLPAQELNRLLEFSDVEGVFTTEDFYRKISDLTLPVFDLDHSDLKLKLFDSCVRRSTKTLCVERDPDVISIIYSSGTTSSMKGIMHTYESVLDSCGKLAFSYGLKPGLRYFIVLPYNHISGYISAAAFVLSGDTLCIMENLTPARLQKGLLEFSPHYFGMVPKVYDIMADKIRDAIHQKGAVVEAILNFGFRLSGFLRKSFGLKIGKFLFKPIYRRALGDSITGLAILGTICKPETARLFLAFGLEWANLYATTETNAPITTTGVFDRYPLNSVGRIDRFADIDIQIHEPDEKGVGEIYVRTPLMMKGYFREPRLTADAMEGGYFKTGDLGYTDSDNYLYLVGRSKDTIVLHSGKKVSAADIDEFYQSVCPEVGIASCGISGPDGFDTVHLFLETAGKSKAELENAHRQIIKQSSAAGSLYQIAAIHEIEKLPVTSVGKIKRFLLKEAAQSESAPQPASIPVMDGEEDVFGTVCNLICSIKRETTHKRETTQIDPELCLQEDIGMDSLELYELCAAIEEKSHVSIEPYLCDGMTVGDIANLMEQGGSGSCESEPELVQYPLPKTEKDRKAYRRFMAVSKALWKIEVSGSENIRPGERYLFCPNHESYLDGMWIVGMLDEQIQRGMCTLAAARLYESRLFRRGLAVLGGIPVHRSGNTAPAMRRAYECLASGKYHLLIHPEGTRSRSGRLGEFKPGAAKLAIDSGVNVIPVCINGAYEIFPPSRKLPRLFDWKHLRRYPLGICFGTPISPRGKTVQGLTEEIRRQVVSMREKGEG